MIDRRSTHVVRIGARKMPVLPRPVDLRTSHPRPVRSVRLPEDDAIAFASSFRASILARTLSLFLVPLMLVYPLAPVFAEELAPAPEPTPSVSESASVTESALIAPDAPEASETAPLSSETEVSLPDAPFDPETPEEVGGQETAAEGGSTGAVLGDAAEDVAADEETPDAGSDLEDADPSVSPSSDVLPEDDTTEGSGEPSFDTDATASSTGSQSGIGSVGGSELATTTDVQAALASSSNVLIEESSASSTEPSSSAQSNAPISSPDAVPEDPSTEPSEDPAIVAAREAAERDALKARLLEEVKAEFLSGCVTLERGGYYCLADDARAGASAPRVVATLSVSASADGKGTDKEIFLSGPDAAIQLTDNAVEDAFPSKDLSGRSVVWQAEEGGRWQIMYADLASSTPIVTAVTAGLESNFNPAVEGATVVWQGWADGNWEIFMAERDIASDAIDQGAAARQVGATPGWRVSRITTNGTHDMFPGIAGGMVTWQAFDGMAWNVYAYSRATGETVRISAGEGSAERPRFAMLWEERGGDGRVRLMGYDMAKGERVDVTEEARTAGDAKRGPGMPPSPVSSPDQPALPLGAASSTAPVRPEGDAPPDPLSP